MEKIDRVLILMGSLSVGLIGLMLLKMGTRLHWRRLTLATTTWYAYAVLLLVPSIGIAIFEEPPYGYLTLGIVLAAGLTIPIGVLAANAAWHFGPEEIDLFYHRPMEPLRSWELKRLILLTGLVILFSIIFFLEVGTAPLLYALQHPGEHHALNQLRQRVTTDVRSPFNYVYFMLRQFGWAFVLSCWLGTAWTERWKLKHYIGFILLLVFGLFYCSVTLTRSPAVVLFVIIFFAYYLFRRGQVSISAIFPTILFAFSIPVLVLFLYTPSRSWESVLEGIGQRIFYAPAKLNFDYIKLFPQEIDFLYGRGIGKTSELVGLFDPTYEYFPIAREVYKRLFPGTPYRGNAPAPFVGMAYANWGLFGPPLYGLLIGFLVQSIQIWLIRQRKSLFVLGVHAVLFYSFFEVNRTDFFATLFSYGGLLLPIFLILLQAKWYQSDIFRQGIFSWKLFSERV